MKFLKNKFIKWLIFLRFSIFIAFLRIFYGFSLNLAWILARFCLDFQFSVDFNGFVLLEISWIFYVLSIFDVTLMDFEWMFDKFLIAVRWVFGRCSIDVPLPISYIAFPISMSMSPIDNRLPIPHC